MSPLLCSKLVENCIVFKLQGRNTNGFSVKQIDLLVCKKLASVFSLNLKLAILGKVMVVTDVDILLNFFLYSLVSVPFCFHLEDIFF